MTRIAAPDLVKREGHSKWESGTSVVEALNAPKTVFWRAAAFWQCKCSITEDVNIPNMELWLPQFFCIIQYKWLNYIKRCKQSSIIGVYFALFMTQIEIAIMEPACVIGTYILTIMTQAMAKKRLVYSLWFVQDRNFWFCCLWYTIFSNHFTVMFLLLSLTFFLFCSTSYVQCHFCKLPLIAFEFLAHTLLKLWCDGKQRILIYPTFTVEIRAYPSRIIYFKLIVCDKVF